MELSDQFYTAATSRSGQNPAFPLVRWLGDPQSQFGRLAKENCISTLPEIEHLIVQPSEAFVNLLLNSRVL